MGTERTRRRVLGLLAAAPLAGWPPRGEAAADRVAVLACGRDAASGLDAAYGLTARGAISWRVTLPGRGHGYAVEGDIAIVFGRRPGGFALVVEHATGRALDWLRPAEGHVFAGHGAHLPGGRLMVATEYARDGGQGAVSLRSVEDGYRVLALWPSHGIDPHELILDGETILVANGGLPPGFVTARDDTDLCRPSLARLDARTGRLLDLALPPRALRRISLRHLVVHRGRVMIAGQDQGDVDEDMPLLVEAGPGGLIHHGGTTALRGYAGSIATGAAGLCLTGPRANRATVTADDGAPAVIDLRDVCGVAPLGQGFLLSGGAGHLAWTATGAALRHEGIAFDNHMATTPG